MRFLHRRFRPLAIMVVAVSLSSVGTARAQNTTAADIAAAEAAWRAAAMPEYVMTIVIRCFCPGAGQPQSIHVKNGQAEFVSMADERTRKLYATYDTVEKLFSELHRYAAGGPARMLVSFQRPLGYPSSADVDPAQNVVDDELRFQVLDLRAGSEPPAQVAMSQLVVVPAGAAAASRGRGGAPAAAVPIRDGRVEEFVAEVPAVSEGGRCENFPSMGLPPPAVKMLSYALGPSNRPLRRITVMLAADGRVVRYSDIRGDIRAAIDPSVTPANPLGRVTAVAIDFDRQSAVLRNEHGGQPPNALRASGPDVLVAENVGNPRATAQMIRERCETPGVSGGSR
jgi:hypothetical protein